MADTETTEKTGETKTAKGKQSEFENFRGPKIQAVENAFITYMEAKEAHAASTKNITDAKVKLFAVMKEKEIPIYRYHEEIAQIVQGEEYVEVHHEKGERPEKKGKKERK